MNYEALGRYTAYREKVVEFAARRDAALAELGRLAAVCIDNPGGAVAGQWDQEKAVTLLEKAGQANEELATAMAEANACAQEAGKPLLRLRAVS